MDAEVLPSIHRHPLNPKELFSKEESGVCGFCGEDLHGEVYACWQCNFTAHSGCAENPPSLVINADKIHDHQLTLLPRQHVTFACNACGLYGEGSPYMCLKCSFMIHKECIDLPRVIKISRHPHRIHHTCFLGPGEWSCGVCREKINGKYGAYFCRISPGYAVHSTCARRKDVWDGEELEGIPEEEGDDEIKDSEVSFLPSNILHFSHEHSLRLEDDNGDTEVVHQPENVRCSGCAFPIASEPFYKCGDLCDFFLHKKCVSLPLEITTYLHVHPLTLCTDDADRSDANLSRCGACDLPFNGFRYRCLECKDIEFDIQCSSLSEPFKYHLHDGSHDLFFILQANDDKEKVKKICNVCNLDKPQCVLSCTDCSFSLCFACATLPLEVKYKYDEHLLSHTIAEDVVTGLYWCDLCETELNLNRNHYKCSDCGPVIHTECLLGSFRNMRLGLSFASHGQEYQVVLNDRTSQLRCNHCENDCNEPLLLMSTNNTVYLCSSLCFETYISNKNISIS